MKIPFNPSPIQSVQTIEVISVNTLRGKLDDAKNPQREVTQYWSKDARFLAEHDPWLHEEIE